MIRDNGNWNNWTMLQIEKFPCNDSNEAHARERYWYENMNAKLNSCIPNRSVKEYYDKYNNEHKEHLKEYYIQNKDHIKECKVKYYDENKENILIDGKQEIQCSSCNCMIKKWYLNRHNKTIKHIKNKTNTTVDLLSI
jgi:hypothetical protein